MTAQERSSTSTRKSDASANEIAVIARKRRHQPSSTLYSHPSVLRYPLVHLIAPGQDAALHIFDFLEAGLLEEVDGFGAAHAAFAVRHDLVRRVQLAHALG